VSSREEKHPCAVPRGNQEYPSRMQKSHRHSLTPDFNFLAGMFTLRGKMYSPFRRFVTRLNPRPESRASFPPQTRRYAIKCAKCANYSHVFRESIIFSSGNPPDRDLSAERAALLQARQQLPFGFVDSSMEHRIPIIAASRVTVYRDTCFTIIRRYGITAGLSRTPTHRVPMDKIGETPLWENVKVPIRSIPRVSSDPPRVTLGRGRHPLWITHAFPRVRNTG